MSRYLKRFLLFILVFVYVFKLSYAAPIYASRWHKNNQTIYLYGDMHNYINAFNDLRSESDIITPKFLRNLKRASEVMPCLLLIEDYKTPLIDPELHKYSGLSVNMMKNGMQTFLPLLSKFGHERETWVRQYPNVCFDSIELRCDFYVWTRMLNYLVEGLEIPWDAYQNITKSKGLTLQELIYEINCRLANSVQSCSDPLVAKILNGIWLDIWTRFNFLNNAIMACGFSAEECASLSLSKIVREFYNRPDKTIPNKYIYLREIMDETAAFIMAEVIEFSALCHICKPQPYGKIVIVAGAEHIFNLEYLLEILGYQQGPVEGKEFKEFNTSIRAELYNEKKRVCTVCNEKFRGFITFRPNYQEFLQNERFQNNNDYLFDLEIIVNNVANSELAYDGILRLSKIYGGCAYVRLVSDTAFRWMCR